VKAWLVRGCLEWQKQGLKPPACVTQATEAYREEEDTLAQWRQERCLVGAGLKMKGGNAYSDYSEWSKNNGINPMSNTAFGRRLKKDFSAIVSNGVWYQGIGLLNSSNP